MNIKERLKRNLKKIYKEMMEEPISSLTLLVLTVGCILACLLFCISALGMGVFFFIVGTIGISTIIVVCLDYLVDDHND